MSVRFAVLLLALLPAGTLTGQSTWPGSASNTIGLRFSKIMVAGDNGPGFATFTAVPTARVALSPRLVLEVEVPIARASEEVGFTPQTVSGTVIGNPYIGIELPFGSGQIQAGVRLGVAPGADAEGELAAQLYAILSEFERYEAFIPETSALRVLANFGQVPATGTFTQVRVGATVVRPDDGDFDALLEYGGRVGHHTGSFLLHGGVLGRAILTSEAGSIAERTIHQLAAGVSGTGGRVRPQAEARYYLDEGFDDSRLVLSLGLTVVP